MREGESFEPRAPLAGQVIAISGAGSGIGRATALAALRGGARVMVIDHDQAGIDGTIASGEGRNAIDGALCDVRETAAVDAAISATIDAFGDLTGVVCAAGIDIGGALAEISDEVYARVTETNLGGTFRMIRAALPHMLASEQPTKSVVAISSAVARVAIPGAGIYAATKAGQAALIRNLAVDHAGDGIRANSLLVGSTDTPLMWANVPEDEIDAMRTTIASQVPAGRLADPAEIAAAACWLLSPAASYVTGAEVPCDGGILARCVVEV